MAIGERLNIRMPLEPSRYDLAGGRIKGQHGKIVLRKIDPQKAIDDI